MNLQAEGTGEFNPDSVKNKVCKQLGTSSSSYP